MSVTLCSMRLALRDWLHEFRLSLCSVLALTSMLTPLLILHGVHTGVVSGLKERLLTDPAVLVVIPAGLSGAGYTEAFFDELRALPQTAFVTGRTRDVAAELQLSRGETFLNVTLEPTAGGDPLLARAGIAPPARGGNGRMPVLLSASAARKLQASAGTELGARLSRRLPSGKSEHERLVVQVAGVLPVEATGLDCAFMPLASLTDLQDYRDGFGVPAHGWPGTPFDGVRHFESFRLYARTLEGVLALDQWFAARNMQVRTKAREIASIRSIDQSLTTVVLVIAAAVGAGFLAFMFSSIQASIKRKEKMLGLLRLSGFTRGNLLLYPLTQSLFTGVCGCAAAFGIYGAVAVVINTLFASQTAGGAICTIPAINGAAIFAGVELLAILASLGPAWGASRIEPATVIRNL